MPRTLEEAESLISTLQGKVSDLETDNYNFRSKNRSLTEQLEESNKKVPADGSVVLTKEEAAAQTKELEGYRALGSVKDVTTAINEGKTAKETLAKGERQTTLNEAAGTDFNAKALGRFIPDDAELLKDKKGAWSVKQGDTTTALSDFVKGIEDETGVTLRTKPEKTNLGGGAGNRGNDKDPKEPESFMEAFNDDPT